MNRVTVKSSTIFIATAGKTQVYRSVDEVPPDLRKKLEESTSSLNSATILIADRKGREEIVRAIKGVPSSVRTRLASTLVNSKFESPDAADALPSGMRRYLRHWAEIVLPGAIGVLIWLLLSLKHS